ncbi:MAG: glutathione S-transferase family protein [Rhodospirillaceae bacterium]|jgi:glutathione S-transferase
MAHIELISTKTCPYVQRSRIALMEKGIDFIFTEVDLRNKPDWFLEISPYGKVPVLKHDDKIIYESAVINEYLEEVFPEPSLMPKDPVDRAFARIWVEHCNSRSMSANRSLLMCQDATEQQKLREKLAEDLLFIENEGLAKTSGDGPFWFGDKVTLTDITFFPLFQRLCATEHYRGFKIPDACQRIKALIAAMKQRKSVIGTSLEDDVLIKHYVRYAEPSKAA